MLLTLNEKLKQLLGLVPVGHSAAEKVGKYKNNEKVDMPALFLPYEMIFQILIWLPVKSLLRFKCVCKIWCSIIQDPMFIDKHTNQAPWVMVYEEDQGYEFFTMLTHGGLLLERGYSNNTYQYRVRNPATRCILNLPKPRERKGICTSICFIGSTYELNVVYMDSSKQRNKELLIYNVLRIGAEVTYWKRLDSPVFGNLRNVQPSVWPPTRAINSVFYNIRLVDGLYIDCLDLGNDCITSIKIPMALFSAWTNVWVVTWDGKLSLARIEQGQLNVRVLEDFRNHKWADSKIVISLTFLRDYHSRRIPVRNIFPCVAEGNLVYWRTTDFVAHFTFNTQSKEVKYLTPLSTRRKILYSYQPSLAPLHLKARRPQCQIGEAQDSLLFKLLRLCLCGA